MKNTIKKTLLTFFLINITCTVNISAATTKDLKLKDHKTKQKEAEGFRKINPIKYSDFSSDNSLVKMHNTMKQIIFNTTKGGNWVQTRNNSYLFFTPEEGNYKYPTEELIKKTGLQNVQNDLIVTTINNYVTYVKSGGIPWAQSSITSAFSPYRKAKTTQKEGRAHAGIDIGMRGGQEVKPVYFATKVEFAGHGNGYDHFVKLKHGDFWKTLYAHMKSNLQVRTYDENIETTKTLGYILNSGHDHLHFELIAMSNGTEYRVDPATRYSYLVESMQALETLAHQTPTETPTCSEGEKLDEANNVCVPKTCEEDQYNCPETPPSENENNPNSEITPPTSKELVNNKTLIINLKNDYLKKVRAYLTQEGLPILKQYNKESLNESKNTSTTLINNNFNKRELLKEIASLFEKNKICLNSPQEQSCYTSLSYLKLLLVLANENRTSQARNLLGIKDAKPWLEMNIFLSNHLNTIANENIQTTLKDLEMKIKMKKHELYYLKKYFEEGKSFQIDPKTFNPKNIECFPFKSFEDFSKTSFDPINTKPLLKLNKTVFKNNEIKPLLNEQLIEYVNNESNLEIDHGIIEEYIYPKPFINMGTSIKSQEYQISSIFKLDANKEGISNPDPKNFTCNIVLQYCNDELNKDTQMCKNNNKIRVETFSFQDLNKKAKIYSETPTETSKKKAKIYTNLFNSFNDSINIRKKLLSTEIAVLKILVKHLSNTKKQ
jgi:murein DD-endopeptidase MepM/ murein hydrolase activator NlpD